MRMLGPGIDFEFGELMITQASVRKHSSHGTLNHSFRTTRAQGSKGFLLEAMRVSGVMAVQLLTFFLSGDPDFFSIDDDDKVTAVNVRSKLRLCLSTQNIRNAGG